MMFRTSIFVLLATVLVSQATILRSLIPTPKPGFCPSPIGSYIGTCKFSCKSDASCILTNKKCCPTLCGGSVCATPVATEPVTTTTVAPTTKSGTCPAVSTLFSTKKCFIIPQIAKCVKDDDCPGTEKCCTNGCVLTCRAALP